MEDFDAEFAAFEAELNTVDTKKATEQAQEALAAPNPSTTKLADSKEEDDPPPEKKRRKMDDSKPKIATVQVAAAAAPTINKNYLKSVVNMYETMHENIEKSVDVADKTQSSSSDYSMFPPTMSHTEAKDFMAQQSVYDYQRARNNKGRTDANGNEVKAPGPAKHIRSIAGEVWQDQTLAAWPDNDYRIFVGNLGKEVTTEQLASAFKHFKSYNMSKVVQNKMARQSKGYGFVSFSDPRDMLRAIREKNGAYLGNRPMKIKRGKW
eukprot:CAMPEP_0184031982 /NCGR_PEP_ID=MMETSP0955-20130417/2672_1 /TAXON_ID=627963 /ORGANISM="Aplanochytrium sp, Strain PBS07" /LENGTH=264 /DNA_ID=CAMNT_0026317891 /DNA_START=127 /DNA_END=918 /DNA_ORIENTATION=+